MKNGFTLVELLAVIAILGIIMAITFLSVNIILKNSRESLSETQIANVEEAAKVYYLKEGMAISAECVSVSELINNGYIDANEVKDPKTKSTMNGYVKITYESNQYNYDYSTESCYTIYENGTPVYFNVTSGKVCQEDEAISTTGTKSGCMKFYAFNDDGGGSLNLLLDHNTTAIIEWISEMDYEAANGEEGYPHNEKGPLTVLGQLKTDTAYWQGTIEPSNYEYKGSERPYTVDYAGYKARLITANEIAKIVGNEDWDEASTDSSSYYFDSLTRTGLDTCKKGDTSGCKYGWLYDRTSVDCTNYGCLNNSDSKVNGYWTASANAQIGYLVYMVDYMAYLGRRDLGIDTGVYGGVRPVITVLKVKLK